MGTILNLTEDYGSSYNYVALEKRLSKEKQEEVKKLGVITNSYQGIKKSEGRRVQLLRHYYDIIYRFAFDYSDVSIALNVTEEEKIELQKYEFTGEDERGSEVWIEIKTFQDQPNRIILSFYAELFFEKLYGRKFASKLRNSDDFLRFLANIQEDLKSHKYDALYAFIEKYSTEKELNGINPLNKNSETYKLMKLILSD